jgi:hypothetical protein
MKWKIIVEILPIKGQKIKVCTFKVLFQHHSILVTKSLNVYYAIKKCTACPREVVA